MKRKIYYMIILLSVLMYQSINFQPALAHGTDYRVIEGGETVAVEFFFSNNEPMRYAEVLVFSPDDEKIEYQNGRTDRRGRFAFSPQTSGTWRMEVKDGVGHEVHATLEIELQGAGGIGLKITPAERMAWFGDTPLFGKIVFGLSLILNLTLGMYVFKRRDSGRRSSS